MDAWQLLSIIATVLAILASASAVLVYVRGAWAKARIVALQEHNKDLTDRVDYLEKTETRLLTEVGHLSSENETLKQMVTQRARVDEVLIKLEEHHQRAVELWRDVIRRIERLRGHDA